MPPLNTRYCVNMLHFWRCRLPRFTEITDILGKCPYHDKELEHQSSRCGPQVERTDGLLDVGSVDGFSSRLDPCGRPVPTHR